LSAPKLPTIPCWVCVPGLVTTLLVTVRSSTGAGDGDPSPRHDSPMSTIYVALKDEAVDPAIPNLT
jgi:hypothetical protein